LKAIPGAIFTKQRAMGAVCCKKVGML